MNKNRFGVNQECKGENNSTVPQHTESEVVSIYEIERLEWIKRTKEEREEAKRKALASGVEPFSVDEGLKYYRPDMALNEEQARSSMARLEHNYYSSGARTLAEWGKKKEEYDVYKDSTGHDTYE